MSRISDLVNCNGRRKSRSCDSCPASPARTIGMAVRINKQNEKVKNASAFLNELKSTQKFIDDLLSETTEECPSKNTAASDMVSHPTHYQVADMTYEPIKVINAWNLNFNIGSAVKYLARYKKKFNAIEDLKKAIFYIQDEINHLEKSQKGNK